jgi:hypothetical protein
MKYITILHANLNYAYLPERRYEFVIRNSYELIFDTYREKLPGDQYVFEASGYTIEQMALKTPDVLAKLKAAIRSGQCEFMGSPYAHPMLPNFPEEDGNWSPAAELLEPGMRLARLRQTSGAQPRLPEPPPGIRAIQPQPRRRRPAPATGNPGGRKDR